MYQKNLNTTKTNKYIIICAKHNLHLLHGQSNAGSLCRICSFFTWPYIFSAGPNFKCSPINTSLLFIRRSDAPSISCKTQFLFRSCYREFTCIYTVTNTQHQILLPFPFIQCTLSTTKIKHLKFSKFHTADDISIQLLSQYQSFIISPYLPVCVLCLPFITVIQTRYLLPKFKDANGVKIINFLSCVPSFCSKVQINLNFYIHLQLGGQSRKLVFFTDQIY